MDSEDFDFKGFISVNVGETISEMAYQFGLSAVVDHSEEILNMFNEELNKYLKF